MLVVLLPWLRIRIAQELSSESRDTGVAQVGAGDTNR